LARISEFDISRYTHSGGCPAYAGDDSYAINPIGVIFTGPSSNSGLKAVLDHDHHQLSILGEWLVPWLVPTEKHQKFYGHTFCEDDQAQVGSGAWWESRYHLKLRQGWDNDNSTGDFGFDYDPVRGYYTLSTPHHEKAIDPEESCGESPLPFLHHAVYDDAYDKGGFVQARNWVLNQWVYSGGPGQHPHVHRHSGLERRDEFQTDRMGRVARPVLGSFARRRRHLCDQ